jgi:hypothetical protein
MSVKRDANSGSEAGGGLASSIYTPHIACSLAFQQAHSALLMCLGKRRWIEEALSAAEPRRGAGAMMVALISDWIVVGWPR